jgi:diguanylate cyclase (GGDEF)-like protein
VAQAPDGTIFFGGLDGTTVVEPDAVSPWAYRPPIVVTALQAGRRIIAPGAVNLDASGVTLTPQSRNLALEFAALDYSAPQVLRYQYRLRGYDREWVDADPTQRVATYTHLPPGDYTLDVRATNRLGLWSATPLRVTVLAVPAWYETWWFRALALVAGMFALYALIRLRTEVLLRRQHELEAVVEHRTFELSQANEKLQEISVNDPLTGLRNRRFVNEHLDAESAITLRRYNAWLADPASPPPFDADILFYLIDLDNFKAINDGYGHIAGDALLTGMSALLQDVFRGSDFVARWGGDEFLAIARGSRREEAGEIAERLRAAVAAHEFCIDGQAMNVRVSIGFAAFPFVREAPHAFSWPQVVAFADQALYLAKNAGRNTWRGIVAPDEHAASEGTMQIVSPAHHTVVERTEA